MQSSALKEKSCRKCFGVFLGDALNLVRSPLIPQLQNRKTGMVLHTNRYL